MNPIDWNKDCGILIKRIHDGIGKRANNELRDTGLTLMQARILFLLCETENHQMSLKDLERFFGVAQSTIFGITTRLLEKKLITSFRDQSDSRIKIVALSAEGNECCEKLRTQVSNMEEYLLQQLNEEERLQLKYLLRKIYKTIEIEGYVFYTN